MTPLEQFNEEVMKEFNDLFFREDVARGMSGFGSAEYFYVWKGEPENALAFITQKLAAHKELILKMVRERAPNKNDFKAKYFSSNDDLGWDIGWAECRREFLNNLDTI